MDPQQALTDILDAMASGDVEQAIESAGNLNGWIGRGGFQPDYRKGFWDALERFLTDHPQEADADGWTHEVHSWRPKQGAAPCDHHLPNGCPNCMMGRPPGGYLGPSGGGLR